MSTAALINGPGVPARSAVCRSSMDGPEITAAADNSDQQLARSLKTFASFGGLGWGMLGGGGGGSAFLECQMCWKGCLPNTPRSRRTEVSICRSCCLKDRFYLCLFLTIEDLYFFPDHMAAFRVTGY